MIWNKHSALAGQHAFLSASKPYWLRYSDDKLVRVWTTNQAAQRGTEEHAFAAEAIRLGKKLANPKETLSMYVNDCIGYRMMPEQTLRYSRNCYGHADAISFRQKLLRISDLKTGDTAPNFDQPKVYAALFCLEYDVDPFDIRIELRIYQSKRIIFVETSADEIFRIMDRIKYVDDIIDDIRWEEEV